MAVRLAYVRALSTAQRYVEAVAQLQIVTRNKPDLAAPWLTLGRVAARHAPAARGRVAAAAIPAELRTNSAAPATATDEDEMTTTATAPTIGGLTQAWLLLAQAAEQRGDPKAAEAWLDKIDNPQRALEVQTRRASLLARQGKLREARELVRRVPERTADDARAKVLAEARCCATSSAGARRPSVLAAGNKRFADDADLLYEQAMIEDKLERIAEMERLAAARDRDSSPTITHAHNALGYSLADRSLRLPEAKSLIQKALELAPGDPFIIDSLGWVEFRLGNRDEAARLLRQAYAARPDPEIAAHLGEVLWVSGRATRRAASGAKGAAATPPTRCCARRWRGCRSSL